MSFYKDYIKDHFPVFCLALTVWMVSVFLGIYVAFNVTGSSVQNVDTYIQSIISAKNGYFHILKNGFLTNFKYTLLMCASASFILFLPCTLFLIGFKGFSAGFTSSFIIRLYALKGMAATITTVVLPLCLSLPIFFIMYVSSIEFPLTTFRLRNSISLGQRWKMYLTYAAKMLVLFLLISIITASEAFLSPRFFKVLIK